MDCIVVDYKTEKVTINENTHTDSVSLRNHQPCNSNSRSSCGILHTVTLPVNTHTREDKNTHMGRMRGSLCLYTQIIPGYLELGMKLTQVSPSIVPDATLETSSSRSIHFTSLSWSSSHCTSERGGCEYTRLFPPPRSMSYASPHTY